VLFIIFLQHRTREDNQPEINPMPRQFIALYFFISIIFNLFVFLIVNDIVTMRYFIPFMVLYVPLLAILFEKTEQGYSALAKVGIKASVLLFILIQGIFNLQALSTYDINNSRIGYIKYLSDNNLDYGFATSNVTTELTNGTVRIAKLGAHGLEPGKKFNMAWLTPTQFHDPEYHKGESFLLLTKAEWDSARETRRPFAAKIPDYDDGRFIILRYPSSALIHDTVLDK
jgi:hypothetical protein